MKRNRFWRPKIPKMSTAKCRVPFPPFLLRESPFIHIYYISPTLSFIDMNHTVDLLESWTLISSVDQPSINQLYQQIGQRHQLN